MKWLKSGAGKYLYFMQLFLHYIPFGEIFISQVKVPLYSVCLNVNPKKQNSNQNGKVEKMMVLVKTFDHYHGKSLNFFNSPAKKFETEIQIEI